MTARARRAICLLRLLPATICILLINPFANADTEYYRHVLFGLVRIFISHFDK